MKHQDAEGDRLDAVPQPQRKRGGGGKMGDRIERSSNGAQSARRL